MKTEIYKIEQAYLKMRQHENAGATGWWSGWEALKEAFNEYYLLKKPIVEPKADAWISVKDQLPEVGTWVIGWSNQRECYHFFLDSIDHPDDGVVWLGPEGYLNDEEEITHWMPLPNPPNP